MSVTAIRVEPGDCHPWLLSEGNRPAHPARALYVFLRDEPCQFESRVRCWRHRPDWARPLRTLRKKRAA